MKKKRIRPIERRTTGGSGYTLLEVLVVVTLIALLAAGSTIRFVPVYHRARFEQALGDISFLDRLAREHCRRYGRPSELHLSLLTQSISALSGKTVDTSRLRMPRGVRIEEVMFLDRSIRKGTSTIFVSPLGHTETYGVGLAGPNGQEAWLLIAGVTGQVSSFESRTNVEKVFHQVLAERANAH